MAVHVWRLCIAICLILIQLQMTFAATLDDAKSLHTTLKSGYNKFVRPVKDQSAKIEVNISMSTVALQEFDEVLQRFSIVSVFFMSWKDENMIWNQTSTGIGSIMMGYKEVWIPEIILTNPSAKLDSFGKEWQLLRYDSSGHGFWYPGDLVKATCSLNVRYFPFDIQECSIEMYAWGYSVSEVELIATTDVIDISLMAPHGTWEVVGTHAKTEAVNYVSRATFTFRLKRRQQYIIINVVLPILFLCILNTLVFLMPAEAGERISYSITVLLSIAVFMTIVSDTLPKTSEPTSLYSYFLMLDLIMSALITVVSILNLRVYHKNDSNAIPIWLIRLYRVSNIFLCNLCLGTKTKTNDSVVDISQRKEQVSFVDKLIDKSKKENGQKMDKPNAFNTGKTVAVNFENLDLITWKDISYLIDIVAFVVAFVVIITTFVAFLLVAQSNAA